MNSPVVAKFHWTLEEYMRAHRVQMRHTAAGRKMRRGIFIIAPLTAAFGMLNVIVHGVAPLSLFLVFGGTALVLSPLASPYVLRRHFAKRPDRNKFVTYEFGEDRITSSNEISTSEMEWRAFTRVLRTKEGFLLFSHERAFDWVPVDAFSGTSEVERLSRLAREKVQSFDEI